MIRANPSICTFLCCLLLLLAETAEGLSITSIADGAVVPSNWLRPLVEWEDDAPAGTSYTLTITGGTDQILVQTTERRILIDDSRVAAMLARGAMRFTVARQGAAPGGQAATASVSVDRGALRDRIVYRLVEPLFNAGQDAVLKELRLEEGVPRGIPAVASVCVGCHTYRGDAAAFNSRLGTDRRLFAATIAGGGLDSAQAKIGEFSFVSLSPDGKTIAAAIRTRSAIEVKKSNIEPFDMSYSAGDIALIDAGSLAFQLLEGACEPRVVEDMPSWSPDGASLVFVRYAPAAAPSALNPMSICTIEIAVGRGGEPKPLLSDPPSKYCYFPRYSPDGKWISFVAADASRSYFARRSSDIWLYERSTGRLRMLESNLEGAMDSWHSWSSDGKWLVFSSNRDPSGLTALYLTRIEADGKAHPPVKIASDPLWKVNLPMTVAPRERFELTGELSRLLRAVFR